MKKTYRILSWLLLVTFLIIIVLKSADVIDSHDFAICLWILFAGQLICTSALTINRKFKPVKDREYEILKRFEDGNNHSLVLGYYEGDYYYFETLEWYGDIVFFTGDEKPTLYYVNGTESGYEFISISLSHQ